MPHAPDCQFRTTDCTCGNSEKIRMQERDQHWVRALTETLDIGRFNAVWKRFHEIRDG